MSGLEPKSTTQSSTDTTVSTPYLIPDAEIRQETRQQKDNLKVIQLYYYHVIINI